MSKTTRLLSLILVIAMAFSLVVSGASAAWADDAAKLGDYDTVNYQEAAKVLTYLNIINGIDGEFKPEGNLQRDQAAKIVTLVVTAANDKTADTDEIAPTNTEFSDVPKTHWASGYIQWAFKNNIVSGKGNNEYRPAENVTILQFQKMLLTGLGYGANGEFEGGGWDTATYVKATELGLWGSVEPVTTDRAATREEAMEFALQALKKAPVHYAFNAYAVGSLLNVNSYDERPLYKRHGLALDEGVDKIGYLMYKWVDAKTNDLVYEGYEKAYKEILVGPKTKETDFTNGIIGNKNYHSYVTGGLTLEANDVDWWINGYHFTSAIAPGTRLWTGYDVSYQKDANGDIDFSKPVIWTDHYSDVREYEYNIGYKDLYELLSQKFGAKVTLYTEERVLVHVTIEVQFVSDVSRVSDTSKTFTATTADKYVGKAFKNVGITYSGVTLEDNEFKNGDVISIVPQFDAIDHISTGSDVHYPKQVLKAYASTKNTNYSGYTILDNAVLKFGADKYASYTWIGSDNYDETVAYVQGWLTKGFVGMGTFFSDSNVFPFRFDQFSSALPVRYAGWDDYAIVKDRKDASYWTDFKREYDKTFYPGIFDYDATAMFNGSKYLPLASDFRVRNGAWKYEYIPEVIESSMYGNSISSVAYTPDRAPSRGIFGYDPGQGHLYDPAVVLVGLSGAAGEGLWNTIQESTAVATGVEPDWAYTYSNSNYINSFNIDLSYNPGSTLTLNRNPWNGVTFDANYNVKTYLMNATYKIAADCVLIYDGVQIDIKTTQGPNSAKSLFDGKTEADYSSWYFYLTANGEIGAIVVSSKGPSRVELATGLTPIAEQHATPGSAFSIDLEMLAKPIKQDDYWRFTLTGEKKAATISNTLQADLDNALPTGNYTFDIEFVFTNEATVLGSPGTHTLSDGWFTVGPLVIGSTTVGYIFGEALGLPTSLGGSALSGPYTARIQIYVAIESGLTDSITTQRELFKYILQMGTAYAESLMPSGWTTVFEFNDPFVEPGVPQPYQITTGLLGSLDVYGLTKLKFTTAVDTSGVFSLAFTDGVTPTGSNTPGAKQYTISVPAGLTPAVGDMIEIAFTSASGSYSFTTTVPLTGTTAAAIADDVRNALAVLPGTITVDAAGSGATITLTDTLGTSLACNSNLSVLY